VNGCLMYEPATHRRASHEGNVPEDVHRPRVQRDDDTLRRERDASRVLDHRDTVTEGEALALKPVHRVRGLQNRLARDAFDDRLLHSCQRLRLREAVRKLLDLAARLLQMGSVTPEHRDSGNLYLVELITEQGDGVEITDTLALEPLLNLLDLGVGFRTREKVSRTRHVYRKPK
jgi:hypothetical protein